MATPPKRTTEDRRRQAQQQARDAEGKWVEMGRPVKTTINGKTYSGSLVGVRGGYAYILPHVGPIRKENPTHSPQPEPQPYKVPLKSVHKVNAKGKLPSQKERDRISKAKAKWEADNLTEEERRESEAALREIQQDLKDKLRERAERAEREDREASKSNKPPQGEQDSLFDVPQETKGEPENEDEISPKKKSLLERAKDAQDSLKDQDQDQDQDSEEIDAPDNEEESEDRSDSGSDDDDDSARTSEPDNTSPMNISEDDLKGAIQDAKESGDTDRFHRLTDLDQFGNRHWNRTGDRLLPGEGVKKLKGRTIDDWAEKATDEEKKDAEDKFNARASNEAVKGSEGLRSGATLADLDGTLRRLTRNIDNITAVNPDSDHLPDLKKTRDELAEGIAAERKFRADRAEARRQVFDRNRATKLDRLKELHDSMEDGDLKTQLGKAIADAESAVKDNDGSYRGKEVGSAIETAVRRAGVKNARSVRKNLDKPSDHTPPAPEHRELNGELQNRFRDYSKNVVDRHPLARPNERSIYNGESLVQRDSEDPNKITHALTPGTIVMWNKQGTGKPRRKSDGTYEIVPDPQPVEFIGSENKDGNEQGRGHVKVKYTPETVFRWWELSPDRKEVFLVEEETADTKEAKAEAAKNRTARHGVKNFGYAAPSRLISRETGKPFLNTTISSSPESGATYQTNKTMEYTTADGESISKGMLVRFTSHHKKFEGQELHGIMNYFNKSNGSATMILIDPETMEPITGKNGVPVKKSAKARQVVSYDYDGPAPTVYSYGADNPTDRYAPEPPKVPEGLSRENNGMTFRPADSEESLTETRNAQWGPNDAPATRETVVDNPVATGGEKTPDTSLAPSSKPEPTSEPKTSGDVIDSDIAAQRLVQGYNQAMRQRGANLSMHGARYHTAPTGKKTLIVGNREMFAKYLDHVEASKDGNAYSAGIEKLRGGSKPSNNALTPMQKANMRRKHTKSIADELVRKGLAKVENGELKFDSEDVDDILAVLNTRKSDEKGRLESKDSSNMDRKDANIALQVIGEIQIRAEFVKENQDPKKKKTQRSNPESSAENPDADFEGPSDDDLKNIEDEDDR